MSTTLVWFRDDLRITDNPALTWAAERGDVLGVVIDGDSDRPLGRAATWWREQSVAHLSTKLPLIAEAGDPREIIPRLAREHNAEVAWNRRYHSTGMDEQIKEVTGARSFPGFLLAEPWEINTGSGTPYRVFTPFYKAMLAHPQREPLPAPALAPGRMRIDAPPAPASTPAPAPAWTQTLAEYNTPGEDAALARFHEFLERIEDGVAYDNDALSPAATSGLSAHLRFGEISPAYVWAHASDVPGAAGFLRQLVWRDFAWHRCYHLPDIAVHNVRSQFNAFEWAWTDKAEPSAWPYAFARAEMDPNAEHLDQLAAWQQGETGVPLVDAGMRELWLTGTMHNRVRMVSGSWLTKNLGIHWRHGEEWFWDTLVDADVASNPFNWQWVAGSGDDAAPYFRIFNPFTQQEKFDAEGKYVSTWRPESLLPGYPEPMVDVKESRKVALAAYDDMKATAER